MSSRLSLITKAFTASMVPLLVTPHAFAQSASDELMLEEIVVTATRQATGSQNTALALTAVSGNDLAQQGITDLGDLAKVAPSFYAQEGLANGSPRFSLRGVSTQDITFAGSTPVAIYFDDVYQTALYGTSSNLFDIGRVEVLRGPQGTLFGKNTTGGAISYFSKEPTNNDEGYVDFTMADGGQSDRSVEGAINIPLIDNVLAMRISGKIQNKGNYIDDVFLNRSYGKSETQAFRGQLKWTPSDATTVNLTIAADDHTGDAQTLHAEYLPDVCDQNNPQNNGAAFYFCDFPGGSPLPAPAADAANADKVALNDIRTPENFDNQAVTLRVNQLFDGFNVTSISHYKRGHYLQIQDADGAPGDFLSLRGKLYNQQIGQELRLATDAEKQFSGVLGFYYQHDRVNVDASYASTENADINSDYLQTFKYATKTDTYALFGNLTYKVTDQLSLVAGLRKSDERRTNEGLSNYWFALGDPNRTRFPSFDVTQESAWFDATQPVAPDAVVVMDSPKLKSTPVTWDFTVNYHPMEDMLVFARVAKGYRSGGFNLPGFLNPVLKPSYDPEYIKSYEVGVKSEFLNKSLRVNATAYHYDYNDQQVSIIQNGAPVIQNAGKSKVDGVEVEVKALPVRGVELGGSVGYSKAVYKEYFDGFTDFADKALVQAPKWTAGASVAYTMDVTSNYALRSSTNWTYRSEVFFDPSNEPGLGSPGVTQGSVRFELQPNANKGASVALFVDNVTDKIYSTYAFGLPTVENARSFNTGRKYGVSVGYDW